MMEVSKECCRGLLEMWILFGLSASNLSTDPQCVKFAQAQTFSQLGRPNLTSEKLIQ